MGDLRAYFLGGPRLEAGGQVVPVDTRKALALLAYLALTGSVHRRDSLAAIFWPESDSSGARAALRRTLSTLNTAIDGAGLYADRESIALDPSEHLWIDVVAFRGLIDEVDEHEHAPGHLCAACLARLNQAADLYTGDFMAGFTLRDAPDFDLWQFAETEALRRGIGFVLDQLVREYATRQDYEAALTVGQRRLRLDPLHEAAHRALMRLYALAGQRSSALRQYRECVRMLDQELGVAPLEETTALYEAIQQNQLAAPTVSDMAAPATREVHPAPPQVEALPLVGRTKEWGQITGAHDRARRQGHLIIVEGEAGIGKTRLAEAYRAFAASEGAHVLAARCHQGEAGLAYGPFVTVLRDALTVDDGLLERVEPHWLVEVARLLPEIHTRCPGLPPTVPLDGPGARGRFFEGISQFLLPRAGVMSVLVLEDLHWADSASLDLLAYLVNRLADRAASIFLTWRSEDIPRDHRLRQMAAQQQRGDNALAVTLGRLSEDAIRALVAALELPERWAGADIARRLYQETEGLPFFLAEYISLIQAGEPPASDTSWRVPLGVLDLLHTRLSPVDQAGRQVLTTAALIGRSFDFDTLRAASGRSEEEVVEALEALLAAGLIREEDEPDARLRYDFAHHKLREVVQGETSLARRRLLHRRIARSLAERNPHGEASSQIAYHYEAAGEAELAADYYEQAGRHAQRVIATEQAIAHYRQAVALGHRAVAELHEIIGDLHTLLGAYADALHSYETAAALHAADELPRLEHKLGTVYHRLGEWQIAEGHFQTALDGLGALEDAPLQARVLADFSLTAHRRADMTQAHQLAERALAAAEAASDQRALAQAHNMLGVLARTAGHRKTAREHLEQSLSLAEGFDDESARAAALNNLALVVADGGDYASAIALAQAALALCRQIDDRHREAAVLNNLADYCHMSGDTAASQRYLEEAVVIFSEIGVQAGGYPEIWKLTEW